VLTLPVHDATRFVLVRPHYPENVGAAARAIKTMGFTRLALVKPGRLAVPEHEMAHKMAVKAWDVLEGAARHESLAEAIAGVDWVFATTSRRGVSGNEKTGLAAEDLAQASQYLRIPMAADQPSINLAQAAQLIAYELFVAALEVRNAERGYTPGS